MAVRFVLPTPKSFCRPPLGPRRSRMSAFLRGVSRPSSRTPLALSMEFPVSTVAYESALFGK